MVGKLNSKGNTVQILNMLLYVFFIAITGSQIDFEIVCRGNKGGLKK